MGGEWGLGEAVGVSVAIFLPVIMTTKLQLSSISPPLSLELVADSLFDSLTLAAAVSLGACC